MPYYIRPSPRFLAVQWRGDNADEMVAAFGPDWECPLGHWLVRCGNQRPEVWSPGEFAGSFEEVV